MLANLVHYADILPQITENDYRTLLNLGEVSKSSNDLISAYLEDSAFRGQFVIPKAILRETSHARVFLEYPANRIPDISLGHLHNVDFLDKKNRSIDEKQNFRLYTRVHFSDNDPSLDYLETSLEILFIDIAELLLKDSLKCYTERYSDILRFWESKHLSDPITLDSETIEDLNYLTNHELFNKNRLLVTNKFVQISRLSGEFYNGNSYFASMDDWSYCCYYSITVDLDNVLTTNTLISIKIYPDTVSIDIFYIETAEEIEEYQEISYDGTQYSCIWKGVSGNDDEYVRNDELLSYESYISFIRTFKPIIYKTTG